MSKTFQDFVNEAKQRIRETSIDDVNRKIQAGDRFTILDVREDSEWEKGHLPGAVHLGKGVLERDANKLLPDPGAEIVTYCGGGSRSSLAADVLQQMGYKNVASMAGGFRGWTKSGNKIEE